MFRAEPYLAEAGPLQDGVCGRVKWQQAALLRDGHGSGLAVARHHDHVHARALAVAQRLWHVRAHRVLRRACGRTL
eukprot:730865-Pyramimonas_sp.AAC.1